MGTMYDSGILGVTKDYKKAMFWYKKAADYGDEGAAREYKELKQKLDQQ